MSVYINTSRCCLCGSVATVDDLMKITRVEHASILLTKYTPIYQLVDKNPDPFQVSFIHNFDECNTHARIERVNMHRDQGRTGTPVSLALARWAGWSGGQVGRHVKC